MRSDSQCPKSLWSRPPSDVCIALWRILTPPLVQCAAFLAASLALSLTVPDRPALAQGAAPKAGSLPTGELSDIDSGKVSAPSDKKEERSPECNDFVANPFGLPMEYERDGTHLWWLARVNGTASGPKASRVKSESHAPSDKPRFVLYNLDIKKRTAFPRAAIDLAEPVAMMLQKNALSIVSFQSGGMGLCLEGPGTLVSLSIGKKNEGAVQQYGSYGLLATPEGRMLFDKTRSAIIETDTVTGQKRQVLKVKGDERPLYFDPRSKKLLVVAQSKTERFLVTYAGDSGKETGREKISEKTKIAFTPNGAKVAVDIQGPDGALKIQEFSSWDGAGGKGVYKITLPRGYSPHDARVDVDPANGLAVVTGESQAIRQVWQRAFVYRYRIGKPLTTFVFDGTQYPNLVALSPKGDTIFVEVRSSLTNTTIGGRIFDVSSGKLKIINIHLPPA